MSTSSSSEGGLSDIEQRAQVCRAAICALGTCADSEKQADALKALADVLITDHAVSHKLEIIEEAISVYDQVLQFRPLGHERRDEAVSDLGDALCVFCVYNGTDNSRALRSFDLLREAVQLRSENHPLRAQSLHNLARALFVLGYSQRSGDLALLSECIQLNREALQLRTVGHPERIKSLGNLAVALTHYFEYCGDPESIEEGVHMSREVLQLLKPGHPLRDKSVENLAIALRRLAAFLGGLSTLAEAECLLREALALRPSGHPLRFRTLNNLACSLQTRYGLQALPTALSEAIALRREALNLVPASHPEWSVVMKDLANSLVVDFRYRRDLSSITEAITLLRHALPLLRSVGSPGRHHSMITLAEALLAQFDECKDRACLLEATALYHDALDLCPPGHADRAETLHRLGRLLSRPECQSWPKALALFCEAARNCSAGYSARPVLLSDMSKCFLDPASPFFDLGKGISHLSEGYSNELSHVNQRLGQAVSDLQNVETAYMDAMKNADVSIRDQYGSLILDLHAKIIGLLPRAANFGLDHKTRLQVITGSDEISRNAAARAVLLGRLSQAVELLEEGRGIFWSQTLHLRATVFDGIPDKDRENLLRLLRQLEFGTRNTENSDQTVSQREEALERRRQLDEEVQALISKIRAHSGCGRFLMPAAFQNLLSSLPNGFVVILNASKLGHHVLLLHKTAGLATSLELQPPSSGCTWVGLRARLPRDGGTEIGSNSEPYSRAMRKDSGQFSSLEVVLSQLWTFMVQPVISQLGLQKATGRQRPRLWWCVTGELGFLPIHAAGKYKDTHSSCTADFVVSSYIPTLSSLTKAQSGWEPIPRSSVSGWLICETYTDHGSARHLPGAEEEALLVRECFESSQARVLNAHSPHTSLADLRALMRQSPAHVLHLACHGVQESDPLSSALVMQDGKLSIEDMLQLSLPSAVLAYLSACQTAKGDQNAPDQAVHLAASMLFCGFRSVVGTMWLMTDEDGPKLARRFYQALFAKEILDLDDIAYALDEAIQHLRTQSVPAERWALFMHMGG